MNAVLKTGLAGLLAVAFSMPAHAQDTADTAQSTGIKPLPTAVAHALKTAGIPLASVGIYVQDVASSRPLLAINANTPLNPASTMKLVTTFGALEMLGPAYNWKTGLYATGPQNGDALDGDVYLRGSGDPKFLMENLWYMLRNLRSRGIREIRGDLVLDKTAFEPADNDPARFDGQASRAFNVTPDALLLNFKNIHFTFVPDEIRRTLLILPEPKPVGFTVTNSAHLSEGPCRDWLAGLRFDPVNTDAGVNLTISGTYPASCGENSRNLSFMSHMQYVSGVFHQLWSELGGTLRGKTREAALPANVTLLSEHTSPALSEIVRDINKFSNNVMARQLYLVLGSDMTKLPGNTDRSFRTIKTWLSQKGLEFPELVIENGSGLSRIERISAQNMGLLLVSAFKSPVMPEFISSMPLVANDGTMRKRMRSNDIAGNAHIKTGSLNDVKAVSGYVLDRNGRRVAVVFLINHANAAAGQTATDALLAWVFNGVN